MMRQSSSRNQRSKGGFKLRHFIQVFLLVAICIWLVYQVKHSRDKKRAFEERKVVEAQPLPLRFSRKDLPVVQESDSRSQANRDESEVEDKEEEEQDSKEEAQDEEEKGGVDDWIDEQDQDRQGEENDHEEFTSEEDNNETPVEETDSGNGQGHEDSSAVGAVKENYKGDNFSRSVAQETHSNAVETGFADERTFDDKNLRVVHSDVKGNSSTRDAVVSNFVNFSAMGDFNGSMTNSSSSSLGENTTFSEATNYSMNGTPTEQNGTNLGYINQNEMQTNSSAALPETISMTTSSNFSTESYGEIPGNKTSNLTHSEDENPAKFVEPVHELEDNGKSKTREEGPDEHLKIVSSNTNDGDMSHNEVTKEEWVARAGLGVAGG